MFKKSATVSALVASAGSAMAAVPTEVNTALTDGKTDALAVAALALVIIIGVAVFKYIRKAV